MVLNNVIERQIKRRGYSIQIVSETWGTATEAEGNVTTQTTRTVKAYSEPITRRQGSQQDALQGQTLRDPQRAFHFLPTAFTEATSSGFHVIENGVRYEPLRNAEPYYQAGKLVYWYLECRRLP